jgi:hypothetical protein
MEKVRDTPSKVMRSSKVKFRDKVREEWVRDGLWA